MMMITMIMTMAYPGWSHAKSAVDVTTDSTARHWHGTMKFWRHRQSTTEMTVVIPVSVIRCTATLQLHQSHSNDNNYIINMTIYKAP